MDYASRQKLRSDLRALLEPAVARCGCEIVAIELGGRSKKPSLRIFVDRPQGGVSISDCAAVTHAISPILDVADPLPGSYELEVSSPGIERPVERPADFVKFTGFRARVKLGPMSERRNATGVLRGLDGDSVCLDVGGELLRLPLADVDRVRLDLTLEEFERLGPPAATPPVELPAPAEGVES